MAALASDTMLTAADRGPFRESIAEKLSRLRTRPR